MGTWPWPHFEDWTVRGEPVIFVESSRVPRTAAELQLRCSTLTTLAHANDRSWNIVHQLILQVGNLWPEMEVTRAKKRVRRDVRDLMPSHCGPTSTPASAVSRFDPQLFGVLLLRRLRLALPSPPVLALVAAACEVWGPGVLKRRREARVRSSGCRGSCVRREEGGKVTTSVVRP